MLCQLYLEESRIFWENLNVNKMSVTRAVAYNTASQIFGKFTTAALSLIVIGYLTRYLGVEGFGQFTIAIAYTSFFSVLADLGFFWIVMKELAAGKVDKDYLVSNVFTMRAVVGILIYALAALIGFALPYPLIVKLAIAITVTNFLSLTINHTLVGVFQAKMRIDKAVLTEILGRIFIVATVLFLIKIQAGLLWILIAYSTGSFLNLFASLILVRKYVSLKLAFDLALWKKIFLQSLPMGIVIVLGLIYFKVDTLILSLLKESKDVGIYGAPYKVIEILLALPPMFMGAVFPVLSRYIATKDQRLPLAMQKTFDFLAILALPLVAGTLMLAFPIMKLVAGEEFALSSTTSFLNVPITTSITLQILIFAVGLSYLSQFFSYLVVAAGKQQLLIKPFIWGTLFNIALNIILIPKFSYAAAASITVVSEVLLLILEVKVAYRIFKITPELKTLFKALLASTAMAVVLFFISPWNLFFKILLSILAYFMVLYLLRGISKQLIFSILKAR